VEFEGNVHRDRRVFVNDLRRQNRLIAAGRTVLRFTSADVLGRPDEVIRRPGCAAPVTAAISGPFRRA
jgi:very-short-patch-repair endonuclease